MKRTADERLAQLEVVFARIQDSDSEWWPFAFLRPQPHERLGTARCLVLSLLHGIPVALILAVAGRVAGDPVDTTHLLWFPLSVSLVYFAVFRATFAYFWNRRAARLLPLHVRRRRWLEGTRSSR